MDPYQLAERIASIERDLESSVENYGDVSAAAAVAEAKWKAAHARAIIRLAESALNGKTNVQTREAYAMRECGDLYEAHLLAAAASDTAKQGIYSLRARLDALRTLNANVRAVSGG